MLSSILDQRQRDLVSELRRLLGRTRELLLACDASAEALATMDGATDQLEELFVLVVVGEFNAGKSALVNAILGGELLAEGVTPTTSGIHLLQHGESAGRQRLDEVRERITAPVELLRDLTIVDTPGTNALERRHEAITSEFVPRSDLVLFVTSADRPFTESERSFLEHIREWGKKVVVVVNKVDILKGEGDVEKIRSYIDEHARRLLGFVPQVFPVSAAQAKQARQTGDRELLERSGVAALEGHLVSTLDRAERLRLKLASPLGVADRLLGVTLEAFGHRLEVLREDIQTVADIDRQLVSFGLDLEREFALRLADIDGSLHVMEKRGLEFFDDRLRLLRLPDLLSKEKLKKDFERDVVTDTPAEVEAKVASLIDWLVDSELRQWQALVRHVSRRHVHHEERIVGELGGSFEQSRAALLATVGNAARGGLERFDRRAEAHRMAEGVQGAVTSTAIVEVGAVSLGAAVAALATSSAADVTGLVAAGVMAALGLLILPHRKHRAKLDLKRAIATTRARLMETLTEQFKAEAGRTEGRLRDAVAPYTRFVQGERETLTSRTGQLGEMREAVASMRSRIETGAGTS